MKTPFTPFDHQKSNAFPNKPTCWHYTEEGFSNSPLSDVNVNSRNRDLTYQLRTRVRFLYEHIITTVPTSFIDN